MCSGVLESSDGFLKTLRVREGVSRLGAATTVSKCGGGITYRRRGVSATAELGRGGGIRALAALECRGGRVRRRGRPGCV